MKGSDIPSKSLETGKKGNIILIFTKCKKDDPGNYQLVSLTSVLRKILKAMHLTTLNFQTSVYRHTCRIGRWKKYAHMNTIQCFPELEEGIM